MPTKIFVNLPVKDLKKTMSFFSALGFSFDPQFTDDNAACLIIGEHIYAMLLVETFFKTFTKKEICDPKKSIETILALSLENRNKVDNLADRAIESGGKKSREPEDHGWMYGRSFEDPDGHVWEVFCMDMSKAPQKPGL
jgi:uncharacterized protein